MEALKKTLQEDQDYTAPKTLTFRSLGTFFHHGGCELKHERACPVGVQPVDGDVPSAADAHQGNILQRREVVDQ